MIRHFIDPLPGQEAREPEPLLPQRAAQQPARSRETDSAPTAPAPLHEQLQAVAGNAALQQQLEAADQARSRIETAGERARQQADQAQPKALTSAPVQNGAAAPDSGETERLPSAQSPVMPDEKTAAQQRAAADQARRLDEEQRKASLRTTALAQVVQAFGSQPQHARVATLVRLYEDAPTELVQAAAEAVRRGGDHAGADLKSEIARQLRHELDGLGPLRLAQRLRELMSQWVLPPPKSPPPPPPTD